MVGFMRVTNIIKKFATLLSLSFVSLTAVPWADAQDGLSAPEFFQFVPLSLQTQTAFGIASQRNFGGPETAGLIASICPACVQIGSRGGQNSLAAMGLSQLGVSLPGLDLLSGGSQFFGQALPPETFSPTFQDPFSAGGAFAPGITNALNILGFGTGSTSPVNFGTAFLMGFDPVFSGNTGFSGTFVQSRIPANSVGQKASVSRTLSPVESRYLTLAQQQMDVLQNENSLSELRTELNAKQLLFLYNDPLYSYWNHELNVVLQQIITTRPSYPQAVALAQEIASFTTPPENNAILEERYSKRLALSALSAQVDSEARAFLIENQEISKRLAESSSLQMQTTQRIFGSPEATAFMTDWSNRFPSTFVASPGFQNLTLELEQIFAEFPAFREYLQLNQEVVNLLPTFNNHPLVLQVNKQVTDVNADPEVAQSVARFYTEYTTEVDETLRNTAYKAEVERAYERLNGLIESDPTHGLLRDTQFVAVLAVDELQRQIHDAVANCFANSGQACNPYSDPQVFALLPAFNVDNANLIGTVGQFYELYNRSMYNFSRSQSFLTLQTESSAKVQAALAEVQPKLTAAQERFLQNVNAIPKVSALNNATSMLGLTLRSESPELDTRLNRMAEIIQILTGP